MDQLLQHGLNALILGGTYALLGIGLTLIFGIMRVVNFTHGELYSFGAYMMYHVGDVAGRELLPRAACSRCVLGIALGAAIEFVLLRRLRGADIDTTMLVMIGAWIALQNVEQLTWSGVAKSIDTPFPVLAAGAGPGVGVVEPAVRVRRGAGADRRQPTPSSTAPGSARPCAPPSRTARRPR